jgi:uncharacterized membrane protein YtjA (UPF0391 family)
MMNDELGDIIVIEGNENGRISTVAALMGFDSIAVVLLDIASVLFFVFPVLSFVSLVMGIRGRHSPVSFR